VSIKEHSEARKNLAYVRSHPSLSLHFSFVGGRVPLHVGQEKLHKKPAKGREKNVGNLGPNQAQNSTTLSTMLWKDNNYNIKLSF